MLQKKEPLAVGEEYVHTALRIAHSVSMGVEHLHSQVPPVLHCDLAARSVLIRATDGHTYLADFGLAKCASQFPAMRQLASPSSVQVPIEALECISKRRTPMEWHLHGVFLRPTDVYMFGLFVHELLAGCPPFQNYSDEEAVIQLFKAKLLVGSSELGELCTEVPLAVRELMQSCLLPLDLSQWLEGGEEPKERPGISSVTQQLEASCVETSTWASRAAVYNALLPRF